MNPGMGLSVANVCNKSTILFSKQIKPSYKLVKVRTETCGMSFFTNVITRLIRNFPRFIPAKPGCKYIRQESESHRFNQLHEMNRKTKMI